MKDPSQIRSAAAHQSSSHLNPKCSQTPWVDGPLAPFHGEAQPALSPCASEESIVCFRSPDFNSRLIRAFDRLPPQMSNRFATLVPVRIAHIFLSNPTGRMSPPG